MGVKSVDPFQHKDSPCCVDPRGDAKFEHVVEGYDGFVAGHTRDRSARDCHTSRHLGLMEPML